jgi:hypothetical protein
MYGQNNFNTKHEYHEFFGNVQRNTERVGDIGKVSDDFKKRAYDSFKNHDFNTLAKKQDSFIAPDEVDGTAGRENNRNVNRMEYDFPERHDGKEHSDVMKKVKGTEIKINDVLHAFDKQGYTINSTATAIGTDPIIPDDYKGQIKI